MQINVSFLLCVPHYFRNQSCWRELGGRQSRSGVRERGGKEGRISFYFPPRCLKSKIFCRVLNICFQTASSH